MNNTDSINLNFGWFFNPNFGFYFGGNLKVDCPHHKDVKEIAAPKDEAVPTSEETSQATEAPEDETPKVAAKTDTSKPLTASEKKALEEVLSAQHRKEVKVTDKTRVSEETLYAAAVYRKLSKSDREDFIKALRERNGVLIGKGENSLSKATNEALSRLVREKNISSQEAKELKRYALGKAQLDSDKSNISKISKRIGNGSEGTALDTFRDNKSATKKIFKEFEKANASNNQIKSTNSKYESLSTAGKSSPTSSEQFLWKPVSDSDGKLAVLLPASLTGEVSKVVIESPAGIMIAQGRDGGVGNGGREHYRFNQSGGSYPDGSSVVIHMKDGSIKSVRINETSSRVQR